MNYDINIPPPAALKFTVPAPAPLKNKRHTSDSAARILPRRAAASVKSKNVSGASKAVATAFQAQGISTDDNNGDDNDDDDDVDVDDICYKHVAKRKDHDDNADDNEFMNAEFNDDDDYDYAADEFANFLDGRKPTATGKVNVNNDDIGDDVFADLIDRQKPAAKGNISFDDNDDNIDDTADDEFANVIDGRKPAAKGNAEDDNNDDVFSNVDDEDDEDFADMSELDISDDEFQSSTTI